MIIIIMLYVLGIIYGRKSVNDLITSVCHPGMTQNFICLIFITSHEEWPFHFQLCLHIISVELNILPI